VVEWQLSTDRELSEYQATCADATRLAVDKEDKKQREKTNELANLTAVNVDMLEDRHRRNVVGRELCEVELDCTQRAQSSAKAEVSIESDPQFESRLLD